MGSTWKFAQGCEKIKEGRGVKDSGSNGKMTLAPLVVGFLEKVSHVKAWEAI